MAQITPARRAASHLLWQVLGEGRLLSEVEGDSRLAPPDRARALRLATGTLRGLPRADHVLNPYLRKPPVPRVMAILRLGAFELCTGGDAHGVVNDCVAIAALHKKSAPMKGLVNAVLRKVAAEGPAAWEAAPTPRMPDWLRGPLLAAWGRDAVRTMEAVQAEPPPVDITPKAGAGVLPEGELLPTGSIRLAAPGQISALPGYEEGTWWVQDAAAALPARILGAKPGEAVLDMCAAPGGKTLQLADAGAEVTALDISERRMARVEENLARTGLTARCVIGDALEHEGSYDAILLDAPCSATGTMRRHPDLPYAKDGSEFMGLFELQARMIDRAVDLLKPGGRMVFCTCSLLPDEGEVQIEEALARHPVLRPDPAALDQPGIEEAWRTDACGLRLRPDHWAGRGGIDGFFIAAVKKAAG
ncbi:RsmB/NOP family class I SAM-dependent RNA methyltransferase [Pseudaestuariivita atlantica]|uniref:16S rRNA methyltransferase n=1 Tax=Pseudaestuariivita atlantica TaxID=1317121 RepID=A0A0L1JSY3_9RHOB|nr:RsmB/NOP family class I SAM-dependent RNA methyltransferase [Pseudaestuariivita atlantica]KNG94860.1 16S rRNA methyltransferase [Pseudaestuariivita atlantica]